MSQNPKDLFGKVNGKATLSSGKKSINIDWKEITSIHAHRALREFLSVPKGMNQAAFYTEAINSLNHFLIVGKNVYKWMSTVSESVDSIEFKHQHQPRNRLVQGFLYGYKLNSNNRYTTTGLKPDWKKRVKWLAASINSDSPTAFEK